MTKLLGIKELCEFWQTIKTLLNNKVDKVSGKDLSTNDFTTAEKTKLAGIEDGAQVNIPMVILKYGTSTWDDFINAYNQNAIVYCRASSQSNPATGAQTRMAFMAYVNNETNPTEVEFQYYRSVSSHTDSQQGDQVYVYKLNKSTGWSVLTRNTFTKIVAGTGLASTYSNGTLTLRVDS